VESGIIEKRALTIVGAPPNPRGKKIRGLASYSQSSVSIPLDFKIRSVSLSSPYISAEVAVVLITIAILFPSLSVIIISQIVN
jgi:hypothetical protein